MKSEKVWTSLLLTSSLLLFTSAANAAGRVEFYDYDASTGTFTNAVRDCTVVTKDTRKLTTGWYIVNYDVTIPEGNRLVVEGDVHLVLGATLSVEHPGKGLAAVRTTDATLTIYDTPLGSGALVAVGGANENVNIRGGAGIGGDANGAGGTVTINGGTVTATAGGRHAAGIGGGFGGTGGTVTINGGTVSAQGGEYAAGIGGGYSGDGMVTIHGGTVTATGGRDAAGIGGGWYGGGMVTIHGGTVTATGGIGGGAWGSGMVTISGGRVTTEGIGGGWSAGGIVTISGGIFTNEPQAGWLAEKYGVFENPDEMTKAAYPYAVMAVDIPYLDWDEDQRQMTNAVVRAEDWIEVTSDTRTLTDGAWYVVRGNVVFPDGNLTVQGSAHLILCDGSSLTIKNPGDGKAAVVMLVGTHLAIYGQTEGSGSLTLLGGNDGAGIGNGYYGTGGTVTINGGTVTAQGGDSAAGIGGGYRGTGGTVTINGGTVTATGGYLGAGIGGGRNGAGGTVMINGGAIKAYGSSAGGIGGGIGGSDGTVTISGGIFNIPIPIRWCASHSVPADNPDPATQVDYPYAVVPGCVVTIGIHPKTTAVWTSGDGTVTNAIEGVFFTVPYGTENVSVIFTAKSDYVLEGEATVELGTVTEDIAFGVGNEYAEPRALCTLGDIAYLAWNGSKMVDALLSRYDYALVTSETEEMADGWYVVARDVERGSIKAVGAVNLVLLDCFELKVSGEYYQAGIEVSEGNSLVIYGQMNGTGKLTSHGGSYGAGIGGGDGVAGGNVTINGGAVEARGGSGAAGIGGGSRGAGGTVTINGGAVTASGNGDGEDIGHGKNSSESGTVSISGGIFWKEPEDGWLAPECVKVDNLDVATKVAYPWRVVSEWCTVTVGNFPRGTVAWTSGDGSVTNGIDGTSFEVRWGTENVTVLFTAGPGWEIVGENAVLLGTATGDITFGGESGYRVPDTRWIWPVPYVDADGVTRTKAVGEFDVLTAETRTLTNGWYAVVDDVEITAKTNIVVQGDVHLILCDGASLTVTNAATRYAAVSVGTNAALTIYAQTNQTGRLTAKGGGSAPAIGGSHIGGGCGTVVIHGGTIAANGGANAAAIGGCAKNDGGSVTITGGRIAAAAKSAVASDIGDGSSPKSPCAVSISGGVFARPVDDAWCAEGCTSVPNADPETAADYPYAVRSACRVTVGDCPAHLSAAWTSGDGSVTNDLSGTSFGVMPGTERVTVVFAAESGWEIVGQAVVELGTVTGDIVFGEASGYRVPRVRREPVAYVDVDGREQTKNGDQFAVVTAETRTLTDGWYVVLDDVVIGSKTADANLTVEGDVHLILCDGASLTATNAPNGAAAVSVNTNATLTIYAQAANTGRLDAKGFGSAAAIGGVINGGCGAIAIHGGTVRAQGGTFSAGIGSGPVGHGGSVTITGGRIEAVGYGGAEDIGSGYGAKSPCAVAISGGVFAREPQEEWLAAGYKAVANEDVSTKDAYPWEVISSYPSNWPEADDEVKAKFTAWRTGVGADADLTTPEAQKAFLLNVAVDGIKELKIESIEVDSEGYSTIVVSAPGAFFFDRIDFGNINGILYIEAGKTLKDMMPKAITYWTTTAGKAMIKVKENFIRAVIGFERPDVPADTLLPPEPEQE